MVDLGPRNPHLDHHLLYLWFQFVHYFVHSPVRTRRVRPTKTLTLKGVMFEKGTTSSKDYAVDLRSDDCERL